MKKMLKQRSLAFALICWSVASPLGVVDVHALESSCSFTYVGEYAAPNDSTVTMARGNAKFTCPQAFSVKVSWDWSTTSDMSSIFLSDGVNTQPTGNADIVAFDREPDTTYYLRVSLVEVRVVRQGNINTFPEYPKITSGVVAVKTKAGPDLSHRPPPSGWTYPKPDAPKLFSQTNSPNNNGVCLVFDVPAFPGYDEKYMGKLQFELRHGGLTGSSATTGLDPAGGRIDLRCNNGYNLEYTASILFTSLSADGSKGIRNVASSLTFKTMWNPTIPTTTTTTSTTSTTTSTTTTTTTTTVPKKTTTTTEPKEEEETTVTTKPKSKATTTTSPADFDDGREEEDLVADIQVKKSGANYSIRVTSNQENTRMQIVAKKKGRKNISWDIKTDDSGTKRILTSRKLNGFTLFLRVDGETVDTARG